MDDKTNLLQMCYQRKELSKFLKIVNLIRQTKNIDTNTATKEFDLEYQAFLAELQAETYSTTIVSKSE